MQWGSDVVSKELKTSQQLNVLSVRGTGFPEEYLRGSACDSVVQLTQAPEVFVERMADLTASCVAVGPAWSQEEGYLRQILEQAPATAVISMQTANNTGFSNASKPLVNPIEP